MKFNNRSMNLFNYTILSLSLYRSLARLHVRNNRTTISNNNEPNQSAWWIQRSPSRSRLINREKYVFGFLLDALKKKCRHQTNIDIRESALVRISCSSTNAHIADHKKVVIKFKRIKTERKAREPNCDAIVQSQHIYTTSTEHKRCCLCVRFVCFCHLTILSVHSL